MDVQAEISRLAGRVEVLEQKIRNLEGNPPALSPSKKKQQSIKEFILSKNPSDDTQKTLLVGYYIEKHTGQEAFNASELEAGFAEAKEKAPGNINDRVNGLIKKGWVMKRKEKRDSKVAWTLTNSGEKAVENNFPKE